MTQTIDFREHFIQELYKINESNFNKKAIALFNYQYNHNKVYKRYVDTIKINPSSVNTLESIPFLPVTFYKSEKILTGEGIPKRCFYSSGTTSIEDRSKHFIIDTDLYQKTFSEIFQNRYGNIEDYIVLALLPSYLENEDSSLLFMVNKLIEDSKHPLSGFISTDYKALIANLPDYRKENKKILLLGVAYALIELAEQFAPDLSDFIIMETGGMKGRRKEMIKAEMHEFLKSKFNTKAIHSEYGMTELLSQAYSKADGIFECCPWMKILVRKVNDPFDISLSGRGGINVIDLANIDSCAFIEIQDMANLHPDGTFELLGRMDNTEQRGCNLLYA